jgi:hypothetical protein
MEVTQIFPSEGGEIVFDLAPIQQQGRLLFAKLLCSLIFEQAIQLDDGRNDLTLVCKNVRLC